MSYVIYNKETTIILPGKNYSNTYATERAAKAALTRAVRDGKVGNRDDYAIAECGEFHEKIEKQVERINLMSREKFMEPINTPNCCSPASETYWSM